MLTDEQGIQAIIALQKMGGVDETKEQAAKGWMAMSEKDRINTEFAHKAVCGGFPEEVTDVKVACKFCDKEVPADTALPHGVGFVCKECWDERLKVTA